MQELEENALSFLKEKEYEKAAKLYLQLAVEHPDNEKYLIAGANCYDSLGDKKITLSLYKKALEINPQSLTALLNISTLYFEIKNYSKSINYANQALAISDNNFSALMNLANVCYAQGDYIKAMEYYNKLYALNPNSYNVIFNIAQTSYNMSQFIKAIDFANMAIEKRPMSVEPYVIAGNAYIELSREAEASDFFKQAFKIEPDSDLLCNSLSNLFQKMGNWKQALHYAWKAFALKKSPVTADDHINFGYILYEAKDENQEELMMNYLKRWEQSFPDNPIVKYMSCALNNVQAVPCSDLEYVKGVFNGFAPSFDEILNELEYSVPVRIGNLMKDNLKTKLFKKRRILDIGCGTGLCTQAVKEYFPNEEFYGVDISEKMVAEAQRKDLYTTLTIEDILSYLSSNEQLYHAVIAGDVLTYIGDLKPLFTLLTKTIKFNGLFCFSVSKNTFNNNDYFLTPSGRFTHTQSYILRLLKYIGFEVLANEECVLRKEGTKNVVGYVILARKEIEIVFE